MSDVIVFLLGLGSGALIGMLIFIAITVIGRINDEEQISALIKFKFSNSETYLEEAPEKTHINNRQKIGRVN